MDQIRQISLLKRPNVRIKDPERVGAILKKFSSDELGGKERLQVVSDFDKTISLCTYNGFVCPTSHGMFKRSRFLTKDFEKEWAKMVEFYLPIERNPNLPREEKLNHMLEWWNKSNEMIVKCSITKDDIKEIVKDSFTHIKTGCKMFFRRLEQHDIPLMIFSAGLGDIIQEWIDHECGQFKNLNLVSNFMEFCPKTKKIIGFKGKVIHIFNKNESVLKGTEHESKICNRTNVILLGDSLGDIDMASSDIESGSCSNESKKTVLKIGFLNDRVDEQLDAFMDAFDIVTIQDDTFDLPNAILDHIFTEK